MKITYSENPLRTTIELDEHDCEVFRLKIRVKELEDRLFSVHHNLTSDTYFDLDRAKRESAPEYYYPENDGDKTPLDKQVDRTFDYYVEALQDSHEGDCTSVACSCIKCRAEDILGIDTIKYFHGKMLGTISGAFNYKENGEWKKRSMSEALAYLRDHKVDRKMPESWAVHYTQESYESFIPGWESKQRLAYEGLLAYAEEHGFK